MRTMDRAMMVGLVAETIPLRSVDDLPMIRQAVNDTADAYRRDGWQVRDWAQDSIVEAIQARVRRMAETPRPWAGMEPFKR